MIPGDILAGRDKGKRKTLKGRSIFMEEAEVLMTLLKCMEFRYVAQRHFKTENVSNLANSNYDLTSCNQHYTLFYIKKMDTVKLFH